MKEKKNFCLLKLLQILNLGEMQMTMAMTLKKISKDLKFVACLIKKFIELIWFQGLMIKKFTHSYTQMVTNCVLTL
jgi:hypothetical protein